MKIIKNCFLLSLISFSYFIIFCSSGHTQENLNDKEAETQEISRESQTLLQDGSIKNNNIFFSD